MDDLEGWPYQPDLCPCDDDFLDWMDAQGISGPPTKIYHMGTGMHHKVGIYCVQRGLECHAITASVDEFRCRPGFSPSRYPGKYYPKLGNIYQVHPETMPMVDIMTLFHLGEMVDRFGQINSWAIDEMIKHVNPGGYVLFYLGSPESEFKSSASDRVMQYVQYNRLISSHSYFKSLQIYTRKAS